jgi:hypothetical protein
MDATASALDPHELTHLLSRLERAVLETARGFRIGMALVAGLFFAMALAYGLAFDQWGSAAMIAPFGVGVLWLGRRAAARTAPDKMRPVVDAVRDAPQRITLVRHYQTSDSRRVFVTHWLEIRTAEHRLVIKAKHDWERLYRALAARCPAAVHVA